MCRVLLTAFEPYDSWPENSSWLTMIQLTRDLPERPQVTTRRYPVDYEKLHEHLAQDLALGFDVVLHLGQAPGSSCIHLETIALNVATKSGDTTTEGRYLVPDGPLAYRTAMPVEKYCATLRQSGFPTRISFHAGTYLCNAALYLSHHIIDKEELSTRALFVHLPLDLSQAAASENEVPSISAQHCADAIRLLIQQIVDDQK